MRNFWVVTSLVFSIVVIGLILYFSTAGSSNRLSPYDIIPLSTPFIVEAADPLSLLGDDSIPAAKAISHLPFGYLLKRELTILDSILSIAGFSHLDVLKHPAHFMLGIHEEGNATFCFIFNLPQTKVSETKKLFGEITDQVKVTPRKLEGHTIHEWKTDAFQQSISFSRLSNLVIFSPSPSLVEQVILSFEKKNAIKNDVNFIEVRQYLSNEPVLAGYIHFPELRQIAPLLRTSIPEPFLTHLPSFGEWASLEIRVSAESLFLTGFLNLKQETTPLFSQFPPLHQDVCVPSDAVHFSTTTLDTQAVKTVANKEAFTYFSSWLSLRGFSVHMTPDQDPEALVFPVNDIEVARKNLIEFRRIANPVDSTIDQSKPIRLHQGILWRELLGMQSFTDSVYAFFIKDHFVISPSSAKAAKIWAAYSSNRFISDLTAWRKIQENRVMNPDFEAYFSPEIFKMELPEEKPFFDSPLFIQLKRDGNIVFLNALLYLGKSGVENQSDASDRLWAVTLDAPPAFHPIAVLNHENQENEILLVDSLHQLYLISAQGQVLWSRKLDGKVMGLANQIDYYKNGKLQVVCNTANSLYIIDRNGKDVAGFPLRFPSKATNSVSVFDYEGKKDYRFFIATASGAIYGYYQNGKPLPGWSPKPNAGKIIYPLEYQRIGAKDYILAFNTAGEIFLFDRKGDKRSKPLITNRTLQHKVIFQPSGDNTRLVWADTSNSLFSGSLSATEGKLVTSFSSAIEGYFPLPEQGLLLATADSVFLFDAGFKNLRKIATQKSSHFSINRLNGSLTYYSWFNLASNILTISDAMLSETISLSGISNPNAKVIELYDKKVVIAWKDGKCMAIPLE